MFLIYYQLSKIKFSDLGIVDNILNACHRKFKQYLRQKVQHSYYLAIKECILVLFVLVFYQTPNIICLCVLSSLFRYFIHKNFLNPFRNPLCVLNSHHISGHHVCLMFNFPHNTWGYWFIFSLFSHHPSQCSRLCYHLTEKQQSLRTSSVLALVLVSHLLFPTAQQQPTS